MPQAARPETQGNVLSRAKVVRKGSPTLNNADPTNTFLIKLSSGPVHWVMAGAEPTGAKKKGRRKQLLRLAIVVPSVVCFFALLWPEIEQMLQSDGTNAITGNCPLFLHDNSSNSSDSPKGGKCPLGLSDSGLPNPHTKSDVDAALGLEGAGGPAQTTADRAAADSSAEVRSSYHQRSAQCMSQPPRHCSANAVRTGPIVSGNRLSV